MSENNDTDEFEIAQTGPLHYTVLSTRSGQRAHRVNIQTVDCSCEDMTFNRGLAADSDGGREICDHIAYVLEQHPQLNATESALYKSMGIMHDAADLQTQIEEQSDQLEEAIVQLRDAQAGLDVSNDTGSTETGETDTETDSTDDSPPGGMTDEDVQQAANDLKAAFDEHLNDMEVQAHAGHVWFKTGYDTEEEWPYPGVDETFKAVTAPDVVEYVYESDDGPDHELYSEKPGEYWKNALDPQDVDEYISEVLE